MTTTKNNRQLRQSSTSDDDSSSRVTAANSSTTSNNNDEGENDHAAAPAVSHQHQQQQQDEEKKQQNKVSTFNNDASPVTSEKKKAASFSSEKKKAAFTGVPVSSSSDHHQHVSSKQLDAESMLPLPDSTSQEDNRQNNNDNSNQDSSNSNRRNSVPGAYRVTPSSRGRGGGGEGSSRGIRSNSSQSEITAAALEHYEAGFPGTVFFVPGESLLRPSSPRQQQNQQRQQQQEEEEETRSQDEFGDNSSLPVAYSVNGGDDVIAGNTTSENDVLEELDRLGVPTIRNAVVIQEPQVASNSNNNRNDEDEENIIPSAVVTNCMMDADPISTTSICCLPKEINRGTVKWICYIALLGIVAVISSIVAIIVYQHGDNNTTTSDGTTTTTTTLLSQEEQDELANRNHIQELISPLSNQEGLQDPTSPQSKAFNWLTNPETNINFYTHSHQDGFNWDSRIIERYVMAVLYYSTDGDNWTRNDSTDKILSLRGASSPICNWRILQCSPMILNPDKDDGEDDGQLDTSKFTKTWAGRVVGINLENVNLQGTIPSEIQHLQYLRDINLSQNPSLVGEVPRVIGKLAHLETFSIDSTNVSGSVEFLCRANTMKYGNSLLLQADLSKVDCSCCECCK